MMGAFDIDQFLAPLSDGSPCGENLEYDEEFGEMERAAQPVAEQQFGKTVVEGKEPEWRDVRGAALSLFNRTKDLRVAVMLARAAVRTDGVLGFCDVLSLIRGLVERYWNEVHPLLDPDDDNDPAIRVNTLLALCDSEACRNQLTESPLISTPVGKFSFRNYLAASGEMPPRGDEKPIDMSTLDAAFLHAEPDRLKEMAAALEGAVENVQGLEAALTDAVGVSRSASFEPLCEQLKKMSRLMAQQLERHGGASPDGAGESGEAGSGEGRAAGAGVVGRPAFDEVRGRDDVIRLIDKICDYYQKQEPSSPVPMLLRRVKRVINMSFFDIIRDLAPNGVSEIETLRGPTEEEGS